MAWCLSLFLSLSSHVHICTHKWKYMSVCMHVDARRQPQVLFHRYHPPSFLDNGPHWSRAYQTRWGLLANEPKTSACLHLSRIRITSWMISHMVCSCGVWKSKSRRFSYLHYQHLTERATSPDLRHFLLFFSFFFPTEYLSFTGVEIDNIKQRTLDYLLELMIWKHTVKT